MSEQQYKRDPKYVAKMRKQKNNGGSLSYPPMYNELEDSPDEMQFGDQQEVDSGDPFQEMDVQSHQDPFEHQSSPSPKSKMFRLRKKGVPK